MYKRIIIMAMTTTKRKFPRITDLFAKRSGLRPLESQQDIVALTESMQKLEASIPARAVETHRIMRAVSERMLAECSSGADSKSIANAISSAVLTYSIVRDIYAGTHKALNEARGRSTANKRDMMYENIIGSVRAPIVLSEASDMKTVFGTIFKEIGEMQLEDFDRVATTLPDFDIFLPRTVLDQVAKKKLEQSARRNSF